jgi:uncharacterized protein HemX
VAVLTERFVLLEKVVEDLNEQRRGLHSTRIYLGIGAVALVLCLGLSIGVGFLFVQVERNQHEIQAVQQRTSSEILCPLYTVFATSIKANPPNPNLTPDQAKMRQEAADTILSGLNKLGCV